MRTKYVWPVAITLLTAVYVWAIFNRAWVLMKSGTAAGIGLGVAVFVLPLLVIVFLVLEWRLALLVDKMAAQLQAEDDLPLEGIGGSASGGVREEDIQRLFERLRRDLEADPDQWRTWYHAAFAYNAMGDRKQARASLREAAKRWRMQAGS